MKYNDFSILTDSEYFKIANEYTNSFKQNCTDINDFLKQLINCKAYLYNPCNTNYALVSELNKHLSILNKLEENFTINYNLTSNKENKICQFNLFLYLKNLFELNNYLHNLYCLEKINKKLIENSITEINNMFISIFELLSKLNIKFFKFM